MLPSIEKSVPDQGSPDDSWHTFGKVERARLVIEMISPTRPAVAARPVLHQPLEG